MRYTITYEYGAWIVQSHDPNGSTWELGRRAAFEDAVQLLSTYTPRPVVVTYEAPRE